MVLACSSVRLSLASCPGGYSGIGAEVRCRPLPRYTLCPPSCLRRLQLAHKYTASTTTSSCGTGSRICFPVDNVSYCAILTIEVAMRWDPLASGLRFALQWQGSPRPQPTQQQNHQAGLPAAAVAVNAVVVTVPLPAALNLLRKRPASNAVWMNTAFLPNCHIAPVAAPGRRSSRSSGAGPLGARRIGLEAAGTLFGRPPLRLRRAGRTRALVPVDGGEWAHARERYRAAPLPQGFGACSGIGYTVHYRLAWPASALFRSGVMDDTNRTKHDITQRRHMQCDPSMLYRVG